MFFQLCNIKAFKKIYHTVKSKFLKYKIKISIIQFFTLQTISGTSYLKKEENIKPIKIYCLTNQINS